MKNMPIPSKVDNLDILVSGQHAENPAELLGTKKMAGFIRFARKNYDVIIIDTPPVLAVADALVLSPMADSALMVVKAGEIGRSEASKAIQSLQQSKINLLGAILNDVKGTVQKKESSSYYYAYQ